MLNGSLRSSALAPGKAVSLGSEAASAPGKAVSLGSEAASAPGKAVWLRRVSGYDDDKDFFVTPEWATQALINMYPDITSPLIHRYAWDPCAGAGHMALPLLRAGQNVLATDLIERRRHPDLLPAFNLRPRIDFLTLKPSPSQRPTLIVMNPPYALADAFVAHALTMLDPLHHDLCAIMPVTRVGGVNRYTSQFRYAPPAYIFPFAERVTMYTSQSKGAADNREDGTLHFAWWIWRKRSEATAAPCALDVLALTRLGWVPPGGKPRKDRAASLRAHHEKRRTASEASRRQRAASEAANDAASEAASEAANEAANEAA